MLKFVDRSRELRQLNDFFRRDQAGLLIPYGRRRVGKTSSLSRWLDRLTAAAHLPPENVLFWTATTQGVNYPLRDFSQVLAGLDPRLPTPPTPEFTFPSWDAALGYVADLAALRPSRSPR